MHTQLRVSKIHRPDPVKPRVAKAQGRYLNANLAASIGPMVDPHEESFLTTKRCNSFCPAPRAISSKKTIPGVFVAYRAFALT